MYREKGRGEKGPAAPLVSITSLHKLGCGSEAKAQSQCKVRGIELALNPRTAA